MLKLLNTYTANPTLKNAQKVRAYSRAHPFATCLLTTEQGDLLAEAIHHANSGVKPMTKAELARRKALWAERKADEAAASNEPWALGNLRVYQNMASKFWAEHYALLRVDE